MPKLQDFMPKTASARIILQTVSAIALLLIPAILAVVLGTRLIIREEVDRQIDQALDGIAYRIDNILLGVEQTAAMVQEDIPEHLDQPQELYKLCRKVLEANPSVSGCAIALNPDYYQFEGKPFMALLYKAQGEICSAETFASRPFTEQEWYLLPIQEKSSSWVGPLKDTDTESEPIISYDVPIIKDGLAVGVLGIDMSLDVLTRMAQQYKTSTHSYITLLDRDGSYIVHPDSTRLLHMSSMAQLRDVEDPSVLEALQDMVEGASGRRSFTLDATQYLMAYMPFRQSAYPGRQESNLGWSIAVIYPKEDLKNGFDPGFRLALIMIVVSLLLLFAGATTIPHISLKPLKELVYLTRIISKGNYRMPVLESSRTDEVGRLQIQYNRMMHAVADQMEELQNLSQKEAEHQQVLARTYERTKELQQHKAAFFGSMTHQMVDTTADMQDSVDMLCIYNADMGEAQTKQLLDSIEKNGLKVAEILNDMLKAKS